MILQKDLENTRIKTGILRLKCKDLNEKISREKQLESKINCVLPVKLDTTNNSESFTTKVLANCLEELKKFYSEFDVCQHNEMALNALQANLWQKIQESVVNVPNIMIWRNLLKTLEKHIETITKMANSNSTVSSNEEQRNLEIILAKINTKLICKGIAFASSKKKTEELKEVCSDKVDALINRIENIFLNFSIIPPENAEDDVIDGKKPNLVI